ncbi:MAG: hypothetical protein RLZZ28_152 [Bacteroidota bacterium]
MNKGFFFMIMLALLALSCEKSITIETAAQIPKLVVEAQIENGQAPIVVLSNSLDYFSSIDAATLNGSYVHGAKITISTGNNHYQLKEFTVPLTGGYFLYYYSIDPTAPVYGDFGKQYGLSIETGGQLYTATTSIPLLTKKIDSIWWKPAPVSVDSAKVIAMIRVTDPPGYGNYIRYFTQVNNQDFYPGLNSVFDDQIIDGKTYDVQVEKGVTKNEKVKREELGFFNKGDTVIVKFTNIDKNSFDFWRTWEFSYQSVGNPFSSPGKVIGNISNDGLGSFCGYAVQYKRLIIPK